MLLDDVSLDGLEVYDYEFTISDSMQFTLHAHLTPGSWNLRFAVWAVGVYDFMLGLLEFTFFCLGCLNYGDSEAT